MKKTCALTGHRDLPQDFDKNAVFDELEQLILDGCDVFLCGMAEGFDLLALECLVALRRKHRITLVACVPFVEHDKFIPQEKRAYYHALLDQCDQTKILSDKYFNGCFLFRDRYMVDNCDLLYAYCTRTTGGTVYTVKYALSKNIKVIYVSDSNPPL